MLLSGLSSVLSVAAEYDFGVLLTYEMQVSSVVHRLSFVVEIFFLKLGNDPDLLSGNCRMKCSLMVFEERLFPCGFSIKLISCWLVGTQTTNRTPAMLMSPRAVFKRTLRSHALHEVLLLYVPKEMAGLKDGSTIMILRMLISVFHQLCCYLYVCVTKCYNILFISRPIQTHIVGLFTSKQNLYVVSKVFDNFFLLVFYILEPLLAHSQSSGSFANIGPAPLYK